MTPADARKALSQQGWQYPMDDEAIEFLRVARVYGPLLLDLWEACLKWEPSIRRTEADFAIDRLVPSPSQNEVLGALDALRKDPYADNEE